jgi:hypothetical protein
MLKGGGELIRGWGNHPVAVWDGVREVWFHGGGARKSHTNLVYAG